ncbi:hypothetical protein Aduo_007626 [Ancylostoma duodenale]
MIALTGSNLFTHIFGCLLMTLNRYMAVCSPSRYHKCWSTRIVFLLLLVDIIVSFGVHADIFFNKFIYQHKNNRWILAARERSIQEVRLITAIVVTIYEILSIILIARTLYVVKKVAPTVRQYFREIGLIIVMAIDSILGVFECIFEVSSLLGFYWSCNPLLKFIHQHYALLFFLIIATNSHSIIFLSRDLRREAIPFFGRRHGSVTEQLIEPPSVIVAPSHEFCDGFLYLIAVYTRVNEPEARNRFRNSYGSLSSKYNFTVIFPLGTGDGEANNGVMQEYHQFGDILQTNFDDSFRNLTLKSYSISNFVRENCTSVRAVLKLDDDVEWNVQKMVAKMATVDVKGKRLYCEVRQCGIPQRLKGGKYFISWEEWPHQFFPPYCVSAAYFGSPHTFVVLHNTTSMVRHIWLDDVFSTGVVGSAASISYEKLNFTRKYSHTEFLKGTTLTYGVVKAKRINRTFMFDLIKPPSVIVAPSHKFCHGFLYLVVVYTRVNDPEARLRFRYSYGSLSSDYNFTVLFPVGTADWKTNNAVFQEHHQYGDILQTNFSDSYRNLTLKSYSLSNFVRKNCTSVRAVLKLDDDVEWNAQKMFAKMATVDVKRKRLYCEFLPRGIPGRTCGDK